MACPWRSYGGRPIVLLSRSEDFRSPIPKIRTAVPKIQTHVTSPHLTSAHVTSPHLTSAHLSSPQLTSPHLTSRHLTSPHVIATATHPSLKESTQERRPPVWIPSWMGVWLWLWPRLWLRLWLRLWPWPVACGCGQKLELLLQGVVRTRVKGPQRGNRRNIVEFLPIPRIPIFLDFWGDFGVREASQRHSGTYGIDSG